MTPTAVVPWLMLAKAAYELFKPVADNIRRRRAARRKTGCKDGKR